MSNIKPVHANSRDGGEVYRLLNLVHVMAGMLANEPKKHFTLARTSSDSSCFGPIVTVWTNGIVDVEARTWPAEYEGGERYHEYSMTAVVKESGE
ncbi:hypothetical protein [Pseudomonas phage HU1]|nr:hypothetical protein [Pseudomonas phage HU1]